MPARSLTVIGRVQGVGFRAFVYSTAGVMAVQGEVWNRRDGGVQVIAEHPDPTVLERFAAQLGHGPGRVDSVIIETLEQKGYAAFTISHSR